MKLYYPILITDLVIPDYTATHIMQSDLKFLINLNNSFRSQSLIAPIKSLNHNIRLRIPPAG